MVEKSRQESQPAAAEFEESQPSSEQPDSGSNGGSNPSQSEPAAGIPGDQVITDSNGAIPHDKTSWKSRLFWIAIGVLLGRLVIPLDWCIEHLMDEHSGKPIPITCHYMVRSLTDLEKGALGFLGIRELEQTSVLILLFTNENASMSEDVLITLECDTHIVAHLLPEIPSVDGSGVPIEDKMMHFAHMHQAVLVLSALPGNSETPMYFVIRLDEQQPDARWEVGVKAGQVEVATLPWPVEKQKAFTFMVKKGNHAAGD